VAEERPTYQTLHDYLVYAPLGAALVFVDEAPRLAQLGRERVEKRVAVARLVGRFAAEEARRRLGAPWSDPSREELRPSGESPRPSFLAHNDVVSPPATASRSAGTSDHGLRTRPSGSEAAGKTTSAQSSSPAANVAGRELPIPGYDTLAASQVVERLASLTAAELEAVRRHESATRRRRTVLHKIAQLSSERDSATA
jgi:hypothetical protein